MSEDTQVDQGVEGTGQTEGVTDPTPAAEPGISNSEAKKLPWVQELMKSKAELEQLRKAQADEAARAEQAAAEAEGNYTKALEMEKKARQEAEQAYKRELTQLKLETEFTRAGLVDPRAVRLFEDGFDPETMNAAEYVASIKADETNQLYFSDPSRRQRQAPPAVTSGPPDDFDPERDLESWLRSSDLKKRARAIEHNRQVYERKLRKG